MGLLFQVPEFALYNEGLRFVIVALPELFSYLFYLKLDREINYCPSHLKVLFGWLVYLCNNGLSNLQTIAHSPDMKWKLYSKI